MAGDPTGIHARIELPEEGNLSAEGQAVYQSVLKTRGNLEGPFLAWLHSPLLAGAAEKLGQVCRYGTHLKPVESELLILIVAAHMRCAAEWQIHAPIALKAGLDAAAVEALRAGAAPDFPETSLATLYAFARELLTTHRVDDGRFAAAHDAFGTATLVEIVGVLGYYSFAAMTLNAFEMRIEGAADPFA